MTKILIIRHGQSTGNIEGKFCGLYDCDLSENGKLQGDIACDFIYNNYNVRAIYTSKLKRACHTIEKLSELTKIKPISMPEFNEIFGGSWEGKKVCEIASEFTNDYSVWKEDIGNGHATGGETWQSVLERVKNGLNEIVHSSCDCTGLDSNSGSSKENVIVLATHGGIVRLIETIYRGLTLSNMKDIPFVPNCSITTLMYDNDKFYIKDSGFVDYLGSNITLPPKGV